MHVPWKDGALIDWCIIGMNHYSVNGERFLYVAMSNGPHYIKEEGRDDEFLWNRLWAKAEALKGKR